MAVDRKRIYHKRDRLRQLRAFCHAARLGSITRSAEHLGISQPAVSLHVRELEHELEAVLFERSGPYVTLTEAGERLYELANPKVESMDALFDHFADHLDEFVVGEVHVAAGPLGVAYLLPPFLKRFRDEHPGIRLHLRESLVHEGLRLLAANEVEFLFGGREPETETFSYHPVLSYDLVLITPEDHPLAGRDSVDIKEAVRYPAVVPDAGTYSRQSEESVVFRFAAEAEVAVQARGWSTIKRCVEAGLGVAVVPDPCLAGNDRVAVVPIGEPASGRSYGIFTRPARPLSPPAGRLIRVIAPDFPDPPPDESSPSSGPPS